MSAILTIDGAVEEPRELSLADLHNYGGLVEDISQIAPRRRGSAVPIGALIAAADPSAAATHITLHAEGDGFAASVPLDAIRDRGYVLFGTTVAPLTESEGGPVRFLVPDAAACGLAEVDTCANVKSLSRIEVTIGKGHDTRQPQLNS